MAHTRTVIDLTQSPTKEDTVYYTHVESENKAPLDLDQLEAKYNHIEIELACILGKFTTMPRKYVDIPHPYTSEDFTVFLNYADAWQKGSLFSDRQDTCTNCGATQHQDQHKPIFVRIVADSTVLCLPEKLREKIELRSNVKWAYKYNPEMQSPLTDANIQIICNECFLSTFQQTYMHGVSPNDPQIKMPVILFRSWKDMIVYGKENWLDPTKQDIDYIMVMNHHFSDHWKPENTKWSVSRPLTYRVSDVKEPCLEICIYYLI